MLLFVGLYFGGGDWAFDQLFWSWLFRYFHVLAGIMWIRLLWYLNFVQIPNMPKITDEQKPAITKVIAPAVLFGLDGRTCNNYYRFNCCLFEWSMYDAMILGIGSGGKILLSE